MLYSRSCWRSILHTVACISESQVDIKGNQPHGYMDLFFFQILFPWRLLHNTDHRTLCYTAGPRYSLYFAKYPLLFLSLGAWEYLMQSTSRLTRKLQVLIKQKMSLSHTPFSQDILFCKTAQRLYAEKVYSEKAREMSVTFTEKERTLCQHAWEESRI